MKHPIEQHATWTTTAVNPHRALELAIQALGGRVRPSDRESIVAEFGSRLGFRLLGGYIGAARQRFPVRLTVQLVAETSGAFKVVATITSNEGWYIVHLPVQDRLFQERSDEIIRQLRAATPG